MGKQDSVKARNVAPWERPHCPVCGGTGRIFGKGTDPTVRCAVCHGNGRVNPPGKK